VRTGTVVFCKQSTRHASFDAGAIALSTTRLTAAVALALALVAPIAAFAQQAPPAPVPPAVAGHRHHANRYREALNRLGLSAAQRSQIDQVFAQHRGENKGADAATRRANRERLRSQVDAILTPAQREQLRTTLRQERRAPAPPAQH
jgi:Spy/CpxP family protein refolding chaperone